MLAWKCRLSLPLLDWSCDEALMRVERSYFAPTGLRFNLIDASCFLDVPVVISVLHGPPNVGAALAVGGAAAARVDEAWLKALAESFGVYRWLRQQALSAAQCPEPDQIESFDDHMLFYASDENAALAAFLDGASERRATADVIALEGATPTAQIEAIVSRLAAHDVTRVRGRCDVARRPCARPPRGARHRTRALRARRLAPCPLSRWYAALECGLRRGTAREAARARGPEPAAPPVSVIERPEGTSRDPADRATSAGGEYRGTVRLAGLIGADGLEGSDPTEDYHVASRIDPGIVDPFVVGAARLERSLPMRLSATRSVKRHSHLPFVQLPPAALGAALLGDALRTRRSRRDYGRGPLTKSALATLLQSAYGVTGSIPGTRRS